MSLTPSEIVQLRIENGPLVPGRVLWVHEPYVAIEIDRDQVDNLSSGADLTLLFESRQKFVSQTTSLEGIIERPAADAPSYAQAITMDLTDSVDRAVVVLEAQGVPAQADHRACYRVRAASSAIQVHFGDRDDCDLMDISQTGFALLSDQQHAQGAVVNACLPVADDRTVCGAVRIQSVRPLRSGRYRYGVTCLEPAFQKACVELTMDLQRERLRQLASHSS